LQMNASSSGSKKKPPFSSISDAISHIVRGAESSEPLAYQSITPTTSSIITATGDANLVPPYETFAGSILSARRIRENIESRLHEGDTVLAKVRSVDVAGARVRLLAGLNKRIDMRDAEIDLIVPMSSLSRRPQTGEQIRVRVDLARPLRCAIDEAMDAIAGPPAMPDYVVESSSYSSWTEKDFPLMLNRHAEESVGAAARGSRSFLKEVHTLEQAYNSKRNRKEAQARAMVTQGITSMRSGERDEAWALLREATEIYPPCADAYVALGALLVNDGRSSDSEKYFLRALEYEPAHKNALLYYKQVLFGAAVLHEKDERWTDAMGCYEKALHNKIDVEGATEGIERCRKELNEREKRSNSVEILDLSKPASAAAAASVKRPRISEGSRKSSDVSQSQRRSSMGVEKTEPTPVKILKQDERKRLSDLEELHAMLKSEAKKK
ncbi:hypothetical protein PFISCL1PPCAC_19141, partial [Pristionchus fissidentatus]